MASLAVVADIAVVADVGVIGAGMEARYYNRSAMAHESSQHREAIDSARRHLAAGRASDAQELCETVLRAEPADADASHLLGLIALSAGRLEEAAQRIGDAIKHRP